jgi:hypothetical protein
MPEPIVLKNQDLAVPDAQFEATFTRLVQGLQREPRLFVLFLSNDYGGLLADLFGMRLDFVVSLFVLLAVFFIGTLGAFFLYVSSMTLFSVLAIMIGLALMFALGLLTGSRWRKLSPFAHRATPIRSNFSVAR